ncbi:MAG: hypothetical protein HFG75_05860 [Hungatella sp.]|nr:hypothetical protein [Hungatella sp.]
MKKEFCRMAALTLAAALWCGACGVPGDGKAGKEEESIQEETGTGSSRKESSRAGTKEGDTGEMISRTEEAPLEQLLMFRNPEMVTEELLQVCEDYVSLVEGYQEEAFEPVMDEQAQSLTELLTGHYEVAGRRAGSGKAYYLAVRRKDAPEYDDFQSLSIGFTDDSSFSGEVCQIGYDDKESREQILYRIPGALVIVYKEMDQQEVLDLLCIIPHGDREDPIFFLAFEEAGRMQLDFMKKHPGLGFHEEGKPSIDFLYQDEDTIEFWSEPYPACIPLEKEEGESLENLLGQGEVVEESLETHRKALQRAKERDPSIRTTGAGFSLDGRSYELWGSRECPGYLLSYVDRDSGKEDIKLEYNQPVYSYVTDRIQTVTGRDYGSFTDTWFDVPLASASMEFPRMERGEQEELVLLTGFQIVEEEAKLEQLAELLRTAIQGHEALSGCPYVGVLNLTREDGETLQMFVAADSCDSITYEGRIGFEYKSQEKLAEIFQEAMGAE